MRILVVSDSHGDPLKLRRAVDQQPTAEMLFFLGDGEHDLEYAGVMLPAVKVRGNCDWGSILPAFSVEKINGKVIYSTHGHGEFVKHGISMLISAAKERGAHIALYGHTHNPVTQYIDGVWYVNPGSIHDGNYAVVDITYSGIMPVLMKIR